jgi:simple sugar transport system permease protein
VNDFYSFMDGLFTTSAPLILASLGALFTELAGVLGIFIEGFMNAGAFFSWIAAGWTGSIILGTILSACAAALIGWAFARFVRKSGANPFIAGLALNIAAGGITDLLSTLLFGTKGVLRNPEIDMSIHLNIPLIENIPLFGPLLSGRHLSVYFSWIAVIGAALFIKHTTWGLKLRASGLSPEAARERGLRPGRYWEGAWAAAAAFSVLAGAVLCFRIGAYTPGGVAGRGWISLAAVYLGFRSAGGVFAAALVFALAERVSSSLQGLEGIPATIFLGLPHAFALSLYAFSHWIRKRRLDRRGILS